MARIEWDSVPLSHISHINTDGVRGLFNSLDAYTSPDKEQKEIKHSLFGRKYKYINAVFRQLQLESKTFLVFLVDYTTYMFQTIK